MCLIVIDKNTLMKLLAAAGEFEGYTQIESCVAAMRDEIKEVSPFLRYRKEVLDDYNTTAKALRRLVLNLWNGMEGLNLSRLFWTADPLHRRVALEMIASYSQRGEKDPAFMALAGDIRAKFKDELEGEA